MKTGLNPETINRRFSRDTIKGSFQAVKTNFGFDRSQPYEDYCCTVFILVSHLRDRPNQCRLLAASDSGRITPLFYNVSEIGNISPEMLASAQKSRRTFVHVMVRMRLFYNDARKLDLILYPEQKRLGHFSNKHVLTNSGLASLEGKAPIPFKRRILLRLQRFATSIPLPQIAQIFNLPVAHFGKKAA